MASADGTVSVIDTNKDEVVKTTQTGGKGSAHIVVAPDIRFLAVSHDESGDVSILRPITREIARTIRFGRGPLSPAFDRRGKEDHSALVPAAVPRIRLRAFCT